MQSPPAAAAGMGRLWAMLLGLTAIGFGLIFGLPAFIVGLYTNNQFNIFRATPPGTCDAGTLPFFINGSCLPSLRINTHTGCISIVDEGCTDLILPVTTTPGYICGMGQIGQNPYRDEHGYVTDTICVNATEFIINSTDFIPMGTLVTSASNTLQGNTYGVPPPPILTTIVQAIYPRSTW